MQRLRINIMNKLIASLVILLIASVASAADHCACCNATMGLRLVKGRHYCKDHYCVKHKAIKSYRDCQECEMERQIKSGKAKCQFCTEKKKLTVKRIDLKNNRSEYNHSVLSMKEPFVFVCPQHYCKTHKLPFTKDNDKIVCSKCAKSATEALWDEKLEGIFGQKLGALVEVKDANKEMEVREFVPEKAFRIGYKYSITFRKGKVIEISAAKEGMVFAEAVAEYNDVIKLLDIKYSRDRRRFDTDGGYEGKSCMYCFDSVSHTPNDAKEIISVSISRMGDGVNYRIAISAGLVDELKDIIDKCRESDLDAL